MPAPTVHDGYANQDFFVDDTAGDDWEEISFGFQSGRQVVICDSVNTLHISWDGENVHGLLTNGMRLDFERHVRSKIYVKNAVGAANSDYRVYAW